MLRLLCIAVLILQFIHISIVYNYLIKNLHETSQKYNCVLWEDYKCILIHSISCVYYFSIKKQHKTDRVDIALSHILCILNVYPIFFFLMGNREYYVLDGRFDLESKKYSSSVGHANCPVLVRTYTCVVCFEFGRQGKACFWYESLIGVVMVFLQLHQKQFWYDIKIKPNIVLYFNNVVTSLCALFVSHLVIGKWLNGTVHKCT